MLSLLRLLQRPTLGDRRPRAKSSSLSGWRTWRCSTRWSPSTGRPATTPISCSTRCTASTPAGRRSRRWSPARGRGGRADLALTCATGCASTTASRCWRGTWSPASAGLRARDPVRHRADGRDRRVVGARRPHGQFRLKRPFPHLPRRWPVPAARCRRSCRSGWPQTRRYQPVTEVVGSGPFRFLKDEHVSGARAAFARFDAVSAARAAAPAGVYLRSQGGAFRAGRVADPRPVLGAGGAAAAARSTGGRTRRATSSTRSPATAT